jgi:hypothetical protein
MDSIACGKALKLDGSVDTAQVALYLKGTSNFCMMSFSWSDGINIRGYWGKSGPYDNARTSFANEQYCGVGSLATSDHGGKSSHFQMKGNLDIFWQKSTKSHEID